MCDTFPSLGSAFESGELRREKAFDLLYSNPGFPYLPGETEGCRVWQLYCLLFQLYVFRGQCSGSGAKVLFPDWSLIHQ